MYVYLLYKNIMITIVSWYFFKCCYHSTAITVIAQLKEALIKDKYIRQLHSSLEHLKLHWKATLIPITMLPTDFHQLLLVNDISTADIPQDQHLTLPLLGRSWFCSRICWRRALGITSTVSTYELIRHWVNYKMKFTGQVRMSVDVETYYHECVACQHCKLPYPQKTPLSSIPIGKRWETVAVNVFQVISDQDATEVTN